MAIMARHALVAAVLTLTFASFAFAQTTATNPAQNNSAPTNPAQAAPKAAPVTFAKGVRAVDSRAPTPQFTAIAAGLYARPVVDTQSAKDDVAIRIWSLSVSPKTNTAAMSLPGAAMLSLTSGSVEYIAGDVRGKMKPGDTAAIPEGASLRFINVDGDRPAILRAVIVSGR